MIERLLRGLEITILLIVLAGLTGYSNPSLTKPIEKVRAYTRSLEFDYVEWMGEAAALKLRSASVSLPQTLHQDEQKAIVTEYFLVTQGILQKEYQLSQLYADPAITDKESATLPVRDELETLYSRQKQIAPLAEAILQEQVSQVLAEINLTAGGQPIPKPGTHGIDELEQLVDSGTMEAALHLQPVSFEELKSVADSGGTMPPKSTYIEPKLRSGLTVYSLEDV